MIYLNLIYITLIIVFINIGGFWRYLEECIGKWFGIRDLHLKILECMFCLNWWVSLIYIICMNHFSIPNMLFILTNSFLTDTYTNILFKIKDLIEKLINNG